MTSPLSDLDILSLKYLDSPCQSHRRDRSQRVEQPQISPAFAGLRRSIDDAVDPTPAVGIGWQSPEDVRSRDDAPPSVGRLSTATGRFLLVAGQDAT
ncbi:hypothetical protein [Bosea sp. UC22_33]|uniref:hypothetical protein n=1 Tax=Bosea sp. UC22_33 TaxID=3350165 RepID=UPI0036732A5C